jgi:hypothetical protein
MNDQIITNIFEIMLNLEKKHYKERYEKGMMCICFSCHKEGHTTHDCFLNFPHKKQNFERIDAILATSNHVERKKDEKNSLNLAIITEVEESSSVIDVDEIIVRNNITDL